MTQDIQFTVGDKDTAEFENSKLAKIQEMLDGSDLSEEDLTLLTQAIGEGANDTLQDLDSDDTE